MLNKDICYFNNSKIKYNLFVILLLFFICGFESVGASMPNSWAINLTINTSLPTLPPSSTPSVFYKDSSWYLIAGDENTGFFGYAWNGTQWLKNMTINASLPSTGYSTPTVFNMDGNWYLLSGKSGTGIVGFAWNGTQWLPNSTINVSSPMGDYITPIVFYKDSSWYMITGGGNSIFGGYAWNGTHWKTNTTINASLPFNFAYASVSPFNMGGTWHLLVGTSSANGFFGFSWNGTQWKPNFGLNSSLYNSWASMAPAVFYKDSSWYIISGEGGSGTGKFLGYTSSLDTTPPTFSQVSINNNKSLRRTTFSVRVNDNSDLAALGQYIFSTNNTGTWVNDSAVSFITTPDWANVTKTLNSSADTTVGYKWYFSDTGGNTNSTPDYILTTSEGGTDFWTESTAITSSLPTLGLGNYSTPSVFYKDSSWYLISGTATGVFAGYAWNGTQWLANSTIIANLPKTGIYSSPSVFYKDSSWYLISGANGVFAGYAWNGTNWLTNLTINASLPNLGSYAAPSVFYKDSSWYLIAGNNLGKFYGYTWNGNNWLTNLTINASLPTIGALSKPCVFYQESFWYLIAGDNTGNFYGFIWDTPSLSWKDNLTINNSLPSIGNYSAPSVFNMSGTQYLISGGKDGNFSGFRYYIQRNQAPDFISISYTPNSIDELDPGVVVNVNVNISDVDDNFNSSTLQWKNSTSNSWTNVTMNNLSVNGHYTLLNVSFTLPFYEDNITFRIIAKDTLEKYNYSNNYTIQNFWDCTWTISPSSLEEIIGFYEDKFIGNITIINTGDIAYANNNCNISFTIGYAGFSSTYTDLLSDSNNWATGNRAFQYSSPIALNVYSNKTFSVNASFPYAASSFTETPSVKITSSINNSITKTSTSYISSTLVIAPPNPLLYQKIATYPSTYLFLTPGNFSLEAYVRNLGYDNSNAANTTAYNVSFNWTLPEEISSKISEGNETSFYKKLNTSSKQYNNLTIVLTSENLASMPKGTFNIAIYSYGYENESGNLSLISNSGNQLILNEIIPINFLCYDTSDGICVASCGVGVDPDCKAPETPVSNPSSGGGSATPKELAVATSAAFQLVRGEQNEVPITFENKDSNKSLNDLVFSVSGNIAKYIDISPKTLSTLGPSQKTVIILTITSPTYIELGKQELIITMKAKKGEYDYTDSKSITLEIHELSIENASILINESRDLINQLNEANISSDYLNQLLNQSEIEITNFNLEAVRNNSNIIKDQVKYALDSESMIKNLESLINSAEEKGIDVSESSRLLELAQLSLQRGEFEQAYKRVKDAQLTYALEVKGEVGKLVYYLKTYPKEISLGVLFLFIFSFGAYNLNKLRGIKKKIKELKREERILNELIRVIQNECFKEKKIGMNEYETAMKEYNRKLSNVVQDLIELETKRAQILRFTSKTKRLKIEREKIISLIKEMQMDYLKKKKIETRTYELKMDSFNKRLAEIEEKFATLETKKALKGIGVSLKIPKGW